MASLKRFRLELIAGAILLAGAIVWLSLGRMFRNSAGPNCSEALFAEYQSPDLQHKIDLVKQTCAEQGKREVLVVFLDGKQTFDPYSQPGTGITDLANTPAELVSVNWTSSQKVVSSYPQSTHSNAGIANFSGEMNLSGIDVLVITSRLN